MSPVIDTYRVYWNSLSAPCTVPARRSIAIEGTIHGTPASTDSVTVEISYHDYVLEGRYCDYYSGGETDSIINRSFRLPYWYAHGVYGFGSAGSPVDSILFDVQGLHDLQVKITTLGGSFDFYRHVDTVRSSCSTGITSLLNYYSDEFGDTITSAPCIFPVTVDTRLSLEFEGTAISTDSSIILIDHRDGVIDTIMRQIVYDPVRSAAYGRPTSCVYDTLTHAYSTEGEYYPYLYVCTNNGLSRPWGVNASYTGGCGASLKIDNCASGRISDVATGRLYLSPCSFPVLCDYNLWGAVTDSATIYPTLSSHFVFGDGSDTTIATAITNDGCGHYEIPRVNFTHRFMIPGVFTSYHFDTAGTQSGGGEVDYGNHPSELILGASCTNISGKFYIDANSSCGRDTSEVKLSYWPYMLVNATVGDTTYGWCNDTGSYQINVIVGNTYKIITDNSLFHYGYSYYSSHTHSCPTLRPSCPSTGIYTFTAASSSTTHDFSFTTAHPPVMDMSISGWAADIIPGDTGTISLWSSNDWGYLIDTLSSDVTFVVDTLLTYVGMRSGPAPTISGDTLKWHFTTSGSLFDFSASIKVQVHTTATIFDTVHNFAYVSPTRLTDPYMANNTYQWDYAVTSSWDPNDKAVSPVGYGPQGFIENGTDLSYMVHFQNTGTARARNITIVDTISPYLDISSLQVIGSGAAVQVYHLPGNVVKFRFDNIYLPDSNHSHDSSTGYIAYSISPVDSLPANTRIANTASIYFDYNPGVVTNTTINTIEDTVGSIAGPDTVCSGSNIALASHISGGTWRTTSHHSSVSGSGIVSGITPGYDTITFIAYGDQEVTKVIYVATSHDSTHISGTINICIGATDMLSPAVSGGVWSASGTAVSVAAGVVHATAAGIDTVVYTVSNGGCSHTHIRTPVSVGAAPVAGSLSGTTTLCAGAASTLSASVTGGTWSTSNLTIASVNASGAMTGIGGGGATISYTVSNAWCSASTTTSITVNAAPAAATLTGTDSLCVGSSTTIMTSATGGIWSSGSLATVAGGVVTGIAGGMDTVYYILSNSCGTTMSRKEIYIKPLANAGTISGAMAVCVGSSITLTDAASGGAWSSTSASNASVNATGVVSGLTLGATVISYSVTNSCGAAAATRTINVITVPVAGTISGPTSVCTGLDTALTVATPGGLWTTSNPSVAVVNSAGSVSGRSAGTANLTYTITNACGTDRTSTLFIVNPQPEAGIMTGPDSICVMGDMTLAGAMSGGTWSSSNPSSVTVSNTGRVRAVSTGSATIRYVVTNMCGSETSSHAVTAKSSSACNTGIATSDLSRGEEKILVYPNPTKGEFTIEIPGNATNVLVIVLDVAGRVVAEIAPKNGSDIKIPVLLSNLLAKGSYQLRIVVDGKLYHERVTIW